MAHTVKTNEDYWENFYKELEISIPSQFCAMVATEIPKGPCVVDLGCGNGRDSIYFASQRHNVCAVDLSHEAVKSCSETAKKFGLDTAHFMQGDLSSFTDLKSLFEKARTMSECGSIIGYSRFVMHSINDQQENQFLSNVGELMNINELIYFEFRSKEDADLDKTFGNHYRRFVDTSAFIEAQTLKHGFKLNYELTGKGMAKYKNEDPFVSRLVFEKV